MLYKIWEQYLKYARRQDSVWRCATVIAKAIWDLNDQEMLYYTVFVHYYTDKNICNICTFPERYSDYGMNLFPFSWDYIVIASDTSLITYSLFDKTTML